MAQNTLKTKGIQEPFILFVGTIEPRKNLENLIRAVALLKNKKKFSGKLIVVGMPGWMGEGVAEMIERLGLRKGVVFLGYLKDTMLRYLYNLAEVFVFPSYYEGFGFPPLEALLAGTPVVTSCNSSLSEVVGAVSGGESAVTLVDAWDVSELALVLRELLCDLPPVSATVRERVRRSYNWDRAAYETLDIIERVA